MIFGCIACNCVDTLDRSKNSHFRRFLSKLLISAIQATSTQPMPTCYECVCGEFVLGLDINLPLLPRRKTDSAYIISKKERTYILNPTLVSSVKVVKRAKGYEKQYRSTCASCGM